MQVCKRRYLWVFTLLLFLGSSLTSLAQTINPGQQKNYMRFHYSIRKADILDGKYALKVRRKKSALKAITFNENGTPLTFSKTDAFDEVRTIDSAAFLKFNYITPDLKTAVSLDEDYTKLTLSIFGFKKNRQAESIKAISVPKLFEQWPIEWYDTAAVVQIDLQPKTNFATPLPVVKLPYRAWGVDAIAVPIKIRTGTIGELPGGVSSGLNLSLALTHTWGRTYFRHGRTPLRGLAFSIVPVMAGFGVTNAGFREFESYQGPTGETDFKSKFNGQTSLDLASFNVGGGFVFDYYGVEFGGFFGTDYLISSSGLASDWYHNGRPWLGIGIGYKIGLLSARSQN